jgi:hypothetical protein
MTIILTQTIHPLSQVADYLAVDHVDLDIQKNQQNQAENLGKMVDVNVEDLMYLAILHF